jgi:CheY-like chemotaxis protein
MYSMQPEPVTHSGSMLNLPAETCVSSPLAQRRPGLLIVDDEQYLRDMLRRWFEGQGFQVWTAPNAEDAIALYERHHDAIALVLLDVRLPETDGPELLHSLELMDSRVRCCFMTGDAGSYSERDLLDAGAIRVLQKPFPLAEMAALLRQLTGVPERRRVARRKGEPVPVLISDLEERDEPLIGWVDDRSAHGMGVSAPLPAVVGSRVCLRSQRAVRGTPWVEAEVKNCRLVGSRWLVGCEFVANASPEVLTQFG